MLSGILMRLGRKFDDETESEEIEIEGVGDGE